MSEAFKKIPKSQFLSCYRASYYREKEINEWREDWEPWVKLWKENSDKWVKARKGRDYIILTIDEQKRLIEKAEKYDKVEFLVEQNEEGKPINIFHISALVEANNQLIESQKKVKELEERLSKAQDLMKELPVIVERIPQALGSECLCNWAGSMEKVLGGVETG